MDFRLIYTYPITTNLPQRMSSSSSSNCRDVQNTMDDLQCRSFYKLVIVHPVIQVPNQLVGAPLGTDVQIECHVEASPKSINYWIKDTGKFVAHILYG